ncbi:geranylgeranyl reductase family protein [Chitinophaga agrisoli]|nr:geranylgeranyl reductase family protein [Chitinophaga agrisoli]
MNQHYDVIIIGAGPAGTACALGLRNAGLRVAIIDKHIFPRDKVCGDAIPGRAIKCLQAMNPAFGAAVRSFPEKLVTQRTRCYYKGKQLEFSWSLEAYTATRMDFDHFLFSLVKSHTNTTVLEGVEVKQINSTDNGYILTTKNDNSTLDCTLLIGADGVNGLSAKRLAGYQMDRRHHVAAVRAYYTGVAGMEDNCTEIYFDKKYLPGYLWVFPIKGGLVNVGLGILSAELVRHHIDVKKAFYDFIDRSPILKSRFKDAVPVGPLQGCGLPLGSRWVQMSGDRFLLAGDAASLIDPVSGDGIGNAVLSGKLAAEQAIRCFQSGNFSAAYMKTYEQELYRMVGAEMGRKAGVLKWMSKMPLLFELAFYVGQHRAIRNFIK